MVDDRAEAVVTVLLLVCLGLFATLRPPLMASRPARIPCAQAEAWMVDCLPGIGSGRGPAALASVRAGRLEELPTAAREKAAVVFSR